MILGHDLDCLGPRRQARSCSSNLPVGLTVTDGPTVADVPSLRLTVTPGSEVPVIVASNGQGTLTAGMSSETVGAVWS